MTINNPLVSTYESTAAVGTVPLAVPAGTQVGDLLVAVVGGQNNSVPQAEAGWTLQSSGSATLLGYAVHTKVATAADLGTTVTFDLAAAVTARVVGVMVSIRGVDTTAIFDVALAAAGVGTAAFAFPSVTPTSAGTQIYAVALFTQQSTTDVSISSHNLDSIEASLQTDSTSTTQDPSVVVGRKLWSSGAFTPTLNVGTTTRTFALTIALRPAASISRNRAGADYAIRGNVAATRTGAGWAVRAALAATRTGAGWAVRAALAATRTGAGWAVLQSISRTRSGAGWNVLQTVSRTRTASWLVAALNAPQGTVTVTIGDWTQTWDLDRDLDEDDVEIINAQGCVLDSLTSSWESEGFMAQPGPTVTQFRVYVPETATGPRLDQGASCRVLVEPRGGSDADYLPLLDTRGKISDGSARPLSRGLEFSVVVVDSLADLGESRVGGEEWPQAWAHDRVNRLKRGMRSDGQTLDYDPLIVINTPADSDDPVDIVDLDWAVDDPIGLFMGPAPQAPVFPVRPAGSAPTNEVLEQVLRQHTRWGPLRADIDNPDILYRTTGILNDEGRSLHPRHRAWYSLYMRPVAVPTSDPSTYRLAWTSPRIEGDAGLPLALVLDDDDQLSVRAKGLDGGRPDSSKYGAWIPAGAVPKNGVTWAVNKDSHPRTARAVGWFQFFQNHWTYYTTDFVVGYLYKSEDGRPAEAQVDVPELSTDTSLVPIGNPQPMAWGLVGWYYDTEPQYELASVDIQFRAIANPDQWPRLFQQPDQDPEDWFAGAQGRFMFLYGIANKWHPYGLDHWWGFLVGASLTIEAGRITGTANLAHRQPGPSGPRGAPSAPDGLDRWTLLSGSSPGTVTWDDFSSSEFSGLTWDDLDPTLRWIDLSMTTL